MALYRASRFVLVGIVGAAATAGIASADPITKDLGGGWSATIFDPIHVDLVTDFVSLRGNRLVIQKFAEFITVDPNTGAPMPVNITFTQNSPDALSVSRIILTEEILINRTGQDWSSFRNVLVDSGQATFNQALSASFSIDPFQTRTYNGPSTEVEFSDGTVPNNSFWTPGSASGGLVIDIDLAAQDPVTFTLKEIPVPTPGSAVIAVLALAGVVTRRRA